MRSRQSRSMIVSSGKGTRRWAEKSAVRASGLVAKE